MIDRRIREVWSGRSRYRSGPVAIGGVGGSGTRVIAGFLRELGFYIGHDLNAASDNLWFTLLLARSNWFAKSRKDEIFEALAIFERVMTGQPDLKRKDLHFLMQAAIDMTFFEYLHWAQTPVKRIVKKISPLRWVLTMAWSVQRILSMTGSRVLDFSFYTGWGWKEPCTYNYVEHLGEYFEQVKYIHVMRNGLDMAYSDNQGHLIAWGPVFGIHVPASAALWPAASLDYWITANEVTLERGMRLLGDRFLVINFDQLCLEPRKQVETLVEFLELKPDPAKLDRLCGLCKAPRSIGRYLKYDTKFRPGAIGAVRRLGFAVKDRQH
jgi:hypothetical protein